MEDHPFTADNIHLTEINQISHTPHVSLCSLCGYKDLTDNMTPVTVPEMGAFNLCEGCLIVRLRSKLKDNDWAPYDRSGAPPRPISRFSTRDRTHPECYYRGHIWHVRLDDEDRTQLTLLHDDG